MTTTLATILLAAFLFNDPTDTPQHQTDRYGGCLALQGTATGFFHVERLGERWFFVTPEGHAFFSLGATHAVECYGKDEHALFQARHGGSQEALADFLLAHFQQWGYNSAGYGPLPFMQRRIPYVATIWTEGPRSFSAGARSSYSDIADPAVQERLRKKVRDACAPHVGNPFCLGYVFIDLPIWSPVVAGRKGDPSYVDFIRSLPPHAPGRQAYDAFIAGRSPTDPLAQDEAFLNRLAEIYYECVVGELRLQDPDHLVLGDRFMALPERTPDSILLTASRFVDVLSFQPMGTRTPLRPYLDRIGQLTGKPILLADVNTMTDRPLQGQLDTTGYETRAGEHTLAYYQDAASSPACIGIHRCTIRDIRPWDTTVHRRGLLRDDDSPYPILSDYTTRTNRAVLKLVYP